MAPSYYLCFLICAFQMISLIDVVVSESLYDHSDPVYELKENNFTSFVFNSADVIFVEFYAHWCGHCQRFVPLWIEAAQDFENWNETVKFAAFNCATENCGDYDITGTPTVRGYYPGSRVESTIGEEITIKNIDVLKLNLLTFIQDAQQKGLASTQMPNLLPLRHGNVDSEWSKINVSFLILLFEGEPHSQWSLNIIRDIGISDYFYVRRVPVSNSLLRSSYSVESVPAVAVLTRQNVNETKYLYNQTESDILDFWDSLINITDPIHHIESTTVLPFNSSSHDSHDEVMEVKEDKVYQQDLEKTLHYALTVEIPMQPILNEPQLLTIYQFLEVTSKYLPLSNQTIKFLRSLREWPMRMSLTVISGEEFKEKVEELIDIYGIFPKVENEDWIGCKGSESHYRGYPCGLWTTFHTLFVNSVKKGDLLENRGSSVAKAMINYIHHFFSCRHCAENFAEKVRSVGFSPKTEEETLLWLWVIHNKANLLLKGDITEDPNHPKIVWPHEKNCPKCRSSENYWNLEKVILYLKGVYDESKIEPKKYEDVVNVLDDTLFSNISDKSLAFKKIEEYCHGINI